MSAMEKVCVDLGLFIRWMETDFVSGDRGSEYEDITCYTLCR